MAISGAKMAPKWGVHNLAEAGFQSGNCLLIFSYGLRSSGARSLSRAPLPSRAALRKTAWHADSSAALARRLEPALQGSQGHVQFGGHLVQRARTTLPGFAQGLLDEFW